MKKLILVLTIILVISMGACSNAPNNDYVTQDQLNEQVAILNSRFDNLIMSEGLNGQISYYENESNDEPIMYLSLSGFYYSQNPHGRLKK